MEAKADKPNQTTGHNGTTNGLSKGIENLTLSLHENLTNLDLSWNNIEVFIEHVKLPPALVFLDLSHNKLKNVPDAVLDLENLKILNVSHNEVQYFNSEPKFCHSIELLNISHNNLEGPPCWVWTDRPQNLTKLNLSNNKSIINSFRDGYFEELLNFRTLVTEADLDNCTLGKFTELLSTFPKAKTLSLSTSISSISVNAIIEIPCKGLDKCCELERLNMCNTYIYTINSSIDMYKNLVEINLAYNCLNGLPKEFCNLENLEICVLSVNKLLYLPEEMPKLRKLVRLYLDSNELCMFPDILCELPSLKTLDLYDNHLNDLPENYSHLEEMDMAYNYFEEPEDSAYVEKKEKLRLVQENRNDGRKMVVEKFDDYDEKDTETEDDEELYEMFLGGKKNEDPSIPHRDTSSSPEDWDSDAYWVPSNSNQNMTRSTQSQWLHFVKRKMEEGNFCPMDAHVVSVAESVTYQRLCNPQVVYESEGQFDDYSSDET